MCWKLLLVISVTLIFSSFLQTQMEIDMDEILFSFFRCQCRYTGMLDKEETVWCLINLQFSIYYAGKFSVITFEEFVSIALDAPRVVGIYPEIKNPIFINQHVSSLSSSCCKPDLKKYFTLKRISSRKIYWWDWFSI